VILFLAYKLLALHNALYLLALLTSLCAWRVDPVRVRVAFSAITFLAPADVSKYVNVELIRLDFIRGVEIYDYTSARKYVLVGNSYRSPTVQDS